MQTKLKQRLLGAVILVALAVVFVPMLLTGPVERPGVTETPLAIPPEPDVQGGPLPEPGDLAPRAEDQEMTLSTPEPVPQAPAPGVAAPQPEPVEAPSAPAPGTPAEPASEAPTEAPAVAVDEPVERQDVPAELASWAVQVHSLTQRDRAEAARDALIAQGYRAYVDVAEANGRTYYRVRVGPVIKREEAEALKQKLGAGFVVSHP